MKEKQNNFNEIKQKLNKRKERVVKCDQENRGKRKLKSKT